MCFFREFYFCVCFKWETNGSLLQCDSLPLTSVSRWISSKVWKERTKLENTQNNTLGVIRMWCHEGGRWWDRQVRFLCNKNPTISIKFYNWSHNLIEKPQKPSWRHIQTTPRYRLIIFVTFFVHVNNFSHIFLIEKFLLFFIRPLIRKKIWQRSMK